MDNGLQYKRICADDIHVLALFLNRVFNTQKFSTEYLNDIYFSENSAVGYNVFNGSDLIAHYCVVKRKYYHNNRMFEVGWSVNTAVDENFRGRGFFQDLALRSYALAKSVGLVAIVGVANRNSTRLFLEKLGFEDKGMVRWNVDLFVIYSPRLIRPDNLRHIKTDIRQSLGNVYLKSLPFLKIYSERRFSFLSVYLSNRRKYCGLGFSLPQGWFKSNWQVICLNLLENNTDVQSFLNDFRIDIMESDTF